jgi:hypothetical protein
MNDFFAEMFWLVIAAALLGVAAALSVHSQVLMAIYLIFMALAILGLTHRDDGHD